MKKSFRVYLFIQIFMATAVIIVANRYVAQYFLGDQMEVRAHQELARVVTDCGAHLQSEHAWRDCAKGQEKGQVLSPMIDFFELCSPKLSTHPEACKTLKKSPHQWRPFTTGNLPVVYTKVNVDHQLWHVMKRADEPAETFVVMSDASLSTYLQRLWNLRDRNLIYVLPTIVIMLVILTAYMVYVVMRPIRLMEETLSTLDFQTLHEKTEIQTPYVEFRKLADVYRDLLARLDESYKNAKRFASDAAHELRTPLSILRGNVERLVPELPNGSDKQMRLQNLGDEVDRLILITEKLLMLSRADSNSLTLDIEPVDVSQLLTDLIEDAESFQTNIRFINHIQKDVVWQCDRSLMGQLINNLYSNALKYNLTHDGWIEFKLSRTASEMTLAVTNSSHDVMPDLPDKAFERFYRSDASRTRRSVDGLGLGLSICREIAHVHDGELTLNIPAPDTVSLVLKLNTKSLAA